MRSLEDTDGDGRYDKSTVFLDDLGFPTGVLPWRNGILVTCAPDILYAEDTDGDGKADKREVLYQRLRRGQSAASRERAEVGPRRLAVLRPRRRESAARSSCVKTGGRANANGRDFRIRPDTGELDPQSGPIAVRPQPRRLGQLVRLHQQRPDVPVRAGRPLPAPQPARAGGQRQAWTCRSRPARPRCFRAAARIARYNDLYAANRFTSANSTIVYRDDLFGPAFEGNAFVSEPVHNLVHREVMRPDGLTFTSRRADDEKDSEFLASADNWFRPAMLATGSRRRAVGRRHVSPDDRASGVDSAGDAKADRPAGRQRHGPHLSRVSRSASTPRKIPRLDKLSTGRAGRGPGQPQRLAARHGPADAGVARRHRGDRAAGESWPPSRRPARARVQALWTLELLGRPRAAS